MKQWIEGLLVLTMLSTHAAAQPRSLLECAGWQSIASEGAHVRATVQSLDQKPSLRIDFDFTSGAGYGGAVLDLPMPLPENFEFAMTLRGEGPANNLELKLVDPELLNVWWVNRRAFEWPSQSTRLVSKRRHFQFAWGPSGGKPLEQLGRIELIVAANEGGRGTIWIEDFTFTPLPPARPYQGTPRFLASSGQPEQLPWAAESRDSAPWLAVDFGQPRELGGIAVHPAAGSLGDFDLETSDNGRSWTCLRQVRGAGALPAEIQLPDLQTQWLRLKFSKPDIAIEKLEFLETAAGASANAFWQYRASRARRGIYPRTLVGEQSFWTVIGQPDDHAEALINEEGQIEVDRRGFSLEPFIAAGNGLLTWADGTHEQTLREGWMPIPTVVRRHEAFELRITALAAGEPGRSVVHAAYTLRNTSAVPARGQFVLAVRPIQVLPPWQDLNIIGGWTPIESIRLISDGILVNQNQTPKLVAPSAGWRGYACTLDMGDPVASLAHGLTELTTVQDGTRKCPQRSASAIVQWNFELASGDEKTFLIAVPLHAADPPPIRPQDLQEFESLAERVGEEWRRRTGLVAFRLPAAARQFHDTIRATQAYILINHDGDGFQPGSRTYNRSWMRDGSMTSAAMLELGHDDLVRRFIDFYAPHQFPSGKVPCVVDRRGADPVPEHDSHGQLIWLIANYHRFTKDSDLVRRHFSRVKSAVEYIESLRAQRLTEEFGPAGPPRQEPGKPAVPAMAFRGLVPESISHEGYSAKPMHSFWDSFFILRGLKDAAYLAEVAGESSLAGKWRVLADDFRRSLIESITLVHQAHGIDYLPGCVELGDFDSTSSTILLWPVEEAASFPRPWIDATFDRYWQNFQRRRDSADWSGYTPYELRHVGTFVRLGQRERAWQALEWFFSHQRPAGWRHWAEVVHRDRSKPEMIGDMPHTWCGSDFLNSVRAMFLYEDQGSLVLLAGVPDAWLNDPAGIHVGPLRSEYGQLTLDSRPTGGGVVVRIEGNARPPGGFILPVPGKWKSAIIEGREEALESGSSLRLPRIPAVVELRS
ncbi:MAG: discoidin domain-containing protein [Phycisphaerae bacterium]|nr:discoidin domain-containing protein [Phycisphaerae bacterium]MDW8262339.1 discoidin domain-containing protein [Phycisphaerales bacterium]